MPRAFADCRTDSFALQHVFATYTQTEGPGQGLYWDVQTLEPLASTPAMAAALEVGGVGGWRAGASKGRMDGNAAPPLQCPSPRA